MSEDERDIDVELDDGDLGGMDDEGGSLAGDDGIPENKRCDILVLSILDYTFPFQCSAQCNGKEKERLDQGQLQRITGAISPLLHPSNVFMPRNVFLP